MSTQTNIITIKNDETLVRFLLADDYEAYRERFPEDTITISATCACGETEPTEIWYAAVTDEHWNVSYYKYLHPVEFAEAARRIREYGEGK